MAESTLASGFSFNSTSVAIVGGTSTFIGSYVANDFSFRNIDYGDMALSTYSGGFVPIFLLAFLMLL